MISKATISAAIEHLNTGEIDRFEAKQIKARIKNIFDLTDEEAEKVYRIWRNEYLKNIKS